MLTLSREDAELHLHAALMPDALKTSLDPVLCGCLLQHSAEARQRLALQKGALHLALEAMQRAASSGSAACRQLACVSRTASTMTCGSDLRRGGKAFLWETCAARRPAGHRSVFLHFCDVLRESRAGCSPHLVCKLGIDVCAARRDRSLPIPAPSGLECDLCSLPMLTGPLAEGAEQVTCRWAGDAIKCLQPQQPACAPRSAINNAFASCN